MKASRRFQRAGFIYLISEPHGMFKIGHTTLMTERFATLQLACPYDLQLLDCIAVTDRHRAEAFLHGALAKHHVRGEWYKLPDKQAYDDAIALLRATYPHLLQ